MKDYYQYKTLGFRLPHNIYQKTRKTIMCYSYYLSVVNSVENKSDTEKTERDIENMIIAKQHIEAIDRALNGYVPKEYMPAVFEHAAYGAEYEFLEIKYGISRSTLKRWTQTFTYGVAIELGEAF